jgi:MinD-like ATPase involved in chromosome partitioning or flagellar assembly
MAMAAQRHDRVVAVDACPDQCGPLATRAGLTGRGIGLRELVAADPPVSSLTELRRFLASSGPAGLEVLPGVHDLAGPGLSAEELAWALDVVERWFPIVIADGPPGWLQPVSATLLARADTLVVTARAGSESTLAEDALTALATAGRSDLCAGAVVAVVETGPGRLGRLGGLARRRSDSVGRLAERVHAVVPIPFDPALTGGAAFTWQRLRRRTRAAFEALATAVEEAPQVAYPPPPALDPAAPYDYLSWSGATAS